LDANYQPIRRYVYGLGKDDVEGYVELSEVTGGMFDQTRQGWYSYIKDQVGTIYKVYSDNAKQIIDTRAYDTFGNLVNQTGSSTGNLGFQGKYYDQESGLYYFFNRYYNPANGRFINEDPFRFNSGLNLYTFVGNDSLNYIDPFGLYTCRAKGSSILNTGVTVYRFKKPKVAPRVNITLTNISLFKWKVSAKLWARYQCIIECTDDCWEKPKYIKFKERFGSSKDYYLKGPGVVWGAFGYFYRAWTTRNMSMEQFMTEHFEKKLEDVSAKLPRRPADEVCQQLFEKRRK
jgi:RHS repeat-associated protein